MCSEIAIRRPGMRWDTYVSTVRELSRHFRVIVHHSDHLKSTRPFRRMADHCCCPVDIHASAQASGYDVIDEPMQMHPDWVVQKCRLTK